MDSHCLSGQQVYLEWVLSKLFLLFVLLFQIMGGAGRVEGQGPLLSVRAGAPADGSPEALHLWSPADHDFWVFHGVLETNQAN